MMLDGGRVMNVDIVVQLWGCGKFIFLVKRLLMLMKRDVDECLYT